MTSATGSARRDGFTLIELLVVITILMFLMGLVFVVAAGARKKANVANTRSLIERLEMMVTNYRADVGSYPPDGMDSELMTREGTELRSGAALAHALALPLKIRQLRPGGEVRIISKAAIGDFSAGELWHMEDDEAAKELIDAWGEPSHYDNVFGLDAFSEQGSDIHVHLSLEEGEYEHGEDPREDFDVVRTIGIQNANQVDIWSHGKGGHSEQEMPHETIGNFVVKRPGEEDE